MPIYHSIGKVTTRTGHVDVCRAEDGSVLMNVKADWEVVTIRLSAAHAATVAEFLTKELPLCEQPSQI